MKNETKQTAVEQFIEQLEEQGHSWENASIKTIEISIKVEDYLKLKEQAKAMDREEKRNAYQEGYSQGYAKCEEAEDYYYEQTYGGDK